MLDPVAGAAGGAVKHWAGVAWLAGMTGADGLPWRLARSSSFGTLHTVAGSGCLAHALDGSSIAISFSAAPRDVIQAYGRASVRKRSMAFVVSGGIMDCLMCSTSSFCADRSATISRILPWSEVMSPSAWVGAPAGENP